jgi:hypothetical protein
MGSLGKFGIQINCIAQPQPQIQKKDINKSRFLDQKLLAQSLWD